MMAQFDNLTSFYNNHTYKHLINISFDQIIDPNRCIVTALIYIHCYLDPTDF